MRFHDAFIVNWLIYFKIKYSKMSHSMHKYILYFSPILRTPLQIYFASCRFCYKKETYLMIWEKGKMIYFPISDEKFLSSSLFLFYMLVPLKNMHARMFLFYSCLGHRAKKLLFLLNKPPKKYLWVFFTEFHIKKKHI